MTAGIKANNDGSAAIQVGGTDYIQISSTGNVTMPGNLTVTGTATVNGVPVGGNYILTNYTSPAPWDANTKKAAGLKAVRVSIVGAGGGGAGARGGTGTPSQPTGTPVVCGAGGPGQVGWVYIPAASIPSTPFTLEAGTGGSGGPAPASAGTRSNGSPGGTSSFSTFISLTGGVGGTATQGARGGFTSPVPAANQFQWLNPPGTTPTSTALDTTNGQGYGGAGGTAGAPQPSAAQAGDPGTGYGAAGGGAAGSGGAPVSNPAAGGNGTPALVIVEEFY